MFERARVAVNVARDSTGRSIAIVSKGRLSRGKACRIGLACADKVASLHVVHVSNCCLVCLLEERPGHETGRAGMACFTADEEFTYYVSVDRSAAFQGTLPGYAVLGMTGRSGFRSSHLISLSESERPACWSWGTRQREISFPGENGWFASGCRGPLRCSVHKGNAK